VEKEKNARTERLEPLTAVSPIDGRYREKTEALAPFASEMALIRTRMEVEAKYLVALSGVGLVRPFQEAEREFLINLGPSLTLEQAKRVKEIESTTRHDVKAMEKAFREFVSGTSIEDATEMIHFGLTSEDVNNLSYRLMMKRAVHGVCIPAMDGVVDGFAKMARTYRALPMLARTHGQAAVPTTLGKELANVAFRLNGQVRKLEAAELTGKLNGAVGNFNALKYAAPEVSWPDFSAGFVSGLGLRPNPFTTQINPYDDMIEMFQAVQRVNNVILDVDQDMWRYISDDWFAQEAKKGEVGSSTMPQKVNPIDFENSEGNVQMSNFMLEGMGRKLAVSRLQRDLSDSTVIRNVGAALAYGLIGYGSTVAGLARVRPNAQVMTDRLNENWAILSEGVQTLMRREGVCDPYSAMKDITRGNRFGRDDWRRAVADLDKLGDPKITEGLKARLLELGPDSYIGYAATLTDEALARIESSRLLPRNRR
jgi:adenylosuccinate lyase